MGGWILAPAARPAPSFAAGFPGQINNPAGFAATPGGYPGFLTPASGPLTSGSPGNPTIYAFKDFTGLSLDANWVTFIGCRFKSNVVADNNVSTGATGAQNIVFDYCSFTPLDSLYGGPPGAAWPSAGAGAQTTTFATGINCINGNSGYQYGLTVRNVTDGPITFDHCDIWGFGNAINFPAATTAQMIIQDCWIHDSANTSPQGYHNDGPGYLDAGAPPRNIKIDHCTIASIGTTNALAFQAATGPYVNIAVTNTFFSGFNICVDMCHDVAASTGLIFTDNIFGTDLPWVNGPLSGASMFVTNGSPVNVWRRNKFRVLPGTSTIAGQQFSWVSGDDGKFMLPGGTLSATDYAG